MTVPWSWLLINDVILVVVGGLWGAWLTRRDNERRPS